MTIALDDVQPVTVPCVETAKMHEVLEVGGEKPTAWVITPDDLAAVLTEGPRGDWSLILWMDGYGCMLGFGLEEGESR